MTDPNRNPLYPEGGEPAPAEETQENAAPADAENSEAPAGGTPAGGTPAGGTPAGGTPAGGTPAGGDRAAAGATRENDDENDMTEEPFGGNERTGGEGEGLAEEGEVLSTLDEMLGADFAKLVAERDEYLDSLRRLQADFDNYRKRAMRQQTDLLERATESLMGQLLPVLDVLDLAEAHSSGDDAAGSSLAQIGTLLRDTLSREGLERIDATGVSFDPTVHDAVAHEEGDEEGGGPEIAEVMRAGYRLKGRVLRPAMVKVRG